MNKPKEQRPVIDPENYYVFKHVSNYERQPGYLTIHKTDAVDLLEIIETFQGFLSACGFSMDGRTLELVDNEAEPNDIE
jgi:hypothetical protein